MGNSDEFSGSEVEADMRSVEDGSRSLFVGRKRRDLDKLVQMIKNDLRGASFDGELAKPEPILVPTLGFVRMREEARPPIKATSGSACWDVFAARDAELLVGQVVSVPTGLRLIIPQGYRVDVRSRSGMALKHGVVVANSPGTIDCDYPGELMVILAAIKSREGLLHVSNPCYQIKSGDRIAQISLERVLEFKIQEFCEAPESGDRVGGLGSTGR